MRSFRWHLAVLAFATTAVLLAGVVGVSAAGLASGSIGAVMTPDDCCPPGSHPGQMCPMHKRVATGASQSHDGKAASFCACWNPNPAGLLVAGITLDRIVVSMPMASAAAPADRPRPLINAATVPSSPPPRA